MILYIIIFIILLVFSAFFSGSESAYFSLTPLDLRRMREETHPSGNVLRALKLMDRPGRLLLTILIGNTAVNVGAATIAALFTGRFIIHPESGVHGSMIAEIVVMTLVLLVFSEVSPKVFAVRQAKTFALGVSLPLTWIVTLLKPVSFIFEKATGGISNLLGISKEKAFGDEEELKTLFKMGEEKGTLSKIEREMIHSLFEFRDTTVKEIMVPRMDMVCLDENTTMNEVLQTVKDKRHTRIPVYKETIDNIIGILVIKDLLPYMRRGKQIPPLEELVRKTYFVPESKMIDELLREFQKERLHMAIVVDEYGGTAGLITLEDVLEEIVGDIRDEHDREKPLVHKLDGTTWIADAKVSIEELNERLGLDIPAEEDYESLGGFIFALLGRIPNDKDEVRYKHWLMIVEKVHGQRIKHVRLKSEKMWPDKPDTARSTGVKSL